MNEHEATQKARTTTAFQVVVFSLTNACLKDTVRAQQDSENFCAGSRLRFHLPARIADEHDPALLLEQRSDPLVIGYTAVHKPDHAIRIEIVERQRCKDSGDRRGCAGSLTKPYFLV